MSKENPLVNQLNQTIYSSIPCMPIVSAGSGTGNEDGSICINTKSGHYKPSIREMETAKEVFESITNKPVNIIMKEDKEALKQKYGEKYAEYSGICL